MSTSVNVYIGIDMSVGNPGELVSAKPMKHICM